MVARERQRPGWYLETRLDERHGADEGALPYLRVVHHDGIRSDQRIVSDGASVREKIGSCTIPPGKSEMYYLKSITVQRCLQDAGRRRGFQKLSI